MQDLIRIWYVSASVVLNKCFHYEQVLIDNIQDELKIKTCEIKFYAINTHNCIREFISKKFNPFISQIDIDCMHPIIKLVL